MSSRYYFIILHISFVALLAITTAAAKKVVASHPLPVQPTRPVSSAAPVPVKPVTTCTPSTIPSSVITSEYHVYSTFLIWLWSRYDVLIRSPTHVLTVFLNIWPIKCSLKAAYTLMHLCSNKRYKQIFSSNASEILMEFLSSWNFVGFQYLACPHLSKFRQNCTKCNLNHLFLLTSLFE